MNSEVYLHVNLVAPIELASCCLCYRGICFCIFFYRKSTRFFWLYSGYYDNI